MVIMTNILNMLLLLFLIVCAISVAKTRDLLSAIIIFAAYSLIMAVVWQQLEAPDIAITEAAIGAGVTTLLLIATISKTRREE
ncbi:hydrogenase subunit MbhD domain-containing protein [Candidatus Contubernalis alkalaceticus]|uniref:hydrogenase subunit MbhD domain-containing protein n=1 Tax=Candidatus Contubernalis alkaliaceticus TaxID=338645 RepID=UPI002A4E1215|nr:hydrogenase subunit MbhD domain-containing protein [Candidatus Contubernalis alkalaceticus]